MVSSADGSKHSARPHTAATPTVKVALTNAVAPAMSEVESPHMLQKRTRTAPPVTSGKPSV